MYKFPTLRNWKKEIGSSLYSNTVAAAAGLSILEASFEKVDALLTRQFAGKKEELRGT